MPGSARAWHRARAGRWWASVGRPAAIADADETPKPHRHMLSVPGLGARPPLSRTPRASRNESPAGPVTRPPQSRRHAFMLAGRQDTRMTTGSEPGAGCSRRPAPNPRVSTALHHPGPVWVAAALSRTGDIAKPLRPQQIGHPAAIRMVGFPPALDPERDEGLAHRGKHHGRLPEPEIACHPRIVVPLPKQPNTGCGPRSYPWPLLQAQPSGPQTGGWWRGGRE